MSNAIVPLHLCCMNLKPEKWDELWRYTDADDPGCPKSFESGTLVWDTSKKCYFPVVDEMFEGTYAATSNIARHVTVACSGVMTVRITEHQLSKQLNDIRKSMDILAYADEGEEDGSQWAEVRVHLPFTN